MAPDSRASVQLAVEFERLDELVSMVCAFESDGLFGISARICARLVQIVRDCKKLCEQRPLGIGLVHVWVGWEDLVALELARRRLVTAGKPGDWELVRRQISGTMDRLCLTEGSVLELGIEAVQARGERPMVRSVWAEVGRICREADGVVRP